MLFNSIEFAIFLPIVFGIFWLIPSQNLKWRNSWILLVSYVFYGWWDWRFLGLIIASTLIDYSLALTISRTENKKKRKGLLILSLTANLGLLFFFKYFNFFVENFNEAFTLFGQNLEWKGLEIVLPVGISFYTFQTLSYTIDVYREKLEPTRNVVAFAAFVSFFPQLVAGPIERASNLLPQFFTQKNFSYACAVDGMRQILWGLFKKVVIADSCSPIVNQIFNDTDVYGGSTLAIGAILFAFQIYGDFSGYSDIAIGTSRLFGFNLKRNFAFPYFSRDIAEFWRRWHISLSTWFRDYVYIPLGGSRGGRYISIRNTLIIFLVSGFWHGANWTFIIWGLLNALYFIPLLLSGKNRNNMDNVSESRFFPSISDLLKMTFTFILVTIGWIFFRAQNITQAWDIIGTIFSGSLFSYPEARPMQLILVILLFLLIEWHGRHQEYAIEKFWIRAPRTLRWSFYLLVTISIITVQGQPEDFIYFQF